MRVRERPSVQLVIVVLAEWIFSYTQNQLQYFPKMVSYKKDISEKCSCIEGITERGSDCDETCGNWRGEQLHAGID